MAATSGLDRSSLNSIYSGIVVGGVWHSYNEESSFSVWHPHARNPRPFLTGILALRNFLFYMAISYQDVFLFLFLCHSLCVKVGWDPQCLFLWKIGFYEERCNGVSACPQAVLSIFSPTFPFFSFFSFFLSSLIYSTIAKINN